MSTKKWILNIDDAPVLDWVHGEKYEARMARAGMEMVSEKLGFNVTVLPPGKRAFPLHAHLANEELFFILQGQGTVRIGNETHRVRTGDFISLPAGRASAHQVINDSDGPLRYLAVSTMETPEVAEYPDSGKIAVFNGAEPVTGPAADSLRHFALVKDKVGYWEGED